MQTHDWTTVAVIIFGYAAGTFYQLRYIDAKIETVNRYIDAKMETVNMRLKAIEERLDKIEGKLEQKVVAR